MEKKMEYDMETSKLGSHLILLDIIHSQVANLTGI